MKLSFVEKHLSIKEFEPIELPKFVVITGLNGSGKSQLLQAISTGKAVIDDIEKKQVALFNSANFSPTRVNQVDQKQLDEEYELIIKAFSTKRKYIEQLVNQIEAEIPLTEICKKHDAFYTKLEKHHFSEISQYEKYIEFLDKYKLSVSDLTAQNTKDNRYIRVDFSISLKKLSESLQHSVSTLSDDEMRNYLMAWDSGNLLFPHQFGKIFWDYHIKLDNNNYQKYLLKQNQVPIFKPLSDDEFINRFGEKPWLVFNRILSKFPMLNYRVNSPEGLSRYEKYEYKLISNSDESVTINNDTLSSGEKILMGIICILFRMRIDQSLPKLVLFDEVDSNLHPSMIKIFLDVIKETLLDNGSKVIIVTHSPTSISLAPNDSVYVVNKDESKRIEKADKKEALHILTEGYVTLDQGLRIIGSASNANLSIVTEGRNTSFLKNLVELHNISNVEIIQDVEHMTGVSQLKTLHEFFCKTNIESKVLFVWDCDAGNGSYNEGRIYSYYLPENPHNSFAKSGIENMFSEHLLNDFCTIVKRPNSPEKKTFDSGSKKDFEKFIINRSNLDDYEKFNDLVDLIIKLSRSS